MTEQARPSDPLSPLWQQAQRAAEQGDIPGVLFVWKSLAEKGAWQICARIGEVYERGTDAVPADIQEALYWYRKAVFEGDDPVAHVGLGRAYYNGKGVQRDLGQALKHFERANAYDLPQAKIYLGLMYYRGAVVQKDVKIAESFFSEAASAGFPVAYAYLARIAFFRAKLIRAARLFLKGTMLGIRIAKNDPTDPKLLGI